MIVKQKAQEHIGAFHARCDPIGYRHGVLYNEISMGISSEPVHRTICLKHVQVAWQLEVSGRDVNATPQNGRLLDA